MLLLFERKSSNNSIIKSICPENDLQMLITYKNKDSIAQFGRENVYFWITSTVMQRLFTLLCVMFGRGVASFCQCFLSYCL